MIDSTDLNIPPVVFTDLDAFAYVRCDTCSDYIERRIETLAPHIALYSLRRGMDPFVLTHQFRQGVHARHLAGLPILEATA